MKRSSTKISKYKHLNLKPLVSPHLRLRLFINRTADSLGSLREEFISHARRALRLNKLQIPQSTSQPFKVTCFKQRYGESVQFPQVKSVRRVGVGLSRDDPLVAVYLMIFFAKVVGDVVVSFFVIISFEISFFCDLQKLSKIRS